MGAKCPYYTTRYSTIAQYWEVCNTAVMVNRMRSTRSHTGNRRSHHALNVVRLSKCGNCGALHQSHRICMNCGSYDGRKIIDLAAQVAARAKRVAAKAEQAKVR